MDGWLLSSLLGQLGLFIFRGSPLQTHCVHCEDTRLGVSEGNVSVFGGLIVVATSRRHGVVLPVMGGFLYWALFRCSSTSLGVTQMTCWPFQYFTMLSDCSVLMMSLCVMLVIWLKEQKRRARINITVVWTDGRRPRVCDGVGSVCLPEVFDRQRSSKVPQDLQQDPRPITPVAQLPKIW